MLTLREEEFYKVIENTKINGFEENHYHQNHSLNDNLLIH